MGKHTMVEIYSNTSLKTMMLILNRKENPAIFCFVRCYDGTASLKIR